ncbi:MAG: rod-binding protein [Pseudomonadota bacterium]|nr:rod-binding protein [Pseudomonadota bacterium]
MLPPAAPPLDLLARAAPEAAGGRTREEIAKTAQAFEASMIASLMGEMFKGVEVSAPFGGGHGEEAFRSFLTEAIAKQMAAGGGLGLADDLTRAMLKMQGLE